MALVAFLCAAFALGDAITKACPPGFVRLDADADSCKMAATAANRTYVGSVAYSYYAFGCYWHTFTDRVYLNGYTGTIEAEKFAQPLCAGTASARWLVHAVTCTDKHTIMQAALDLKHPNTRTDSSFCSQTHSFHARPPALHACAHNHADTQSGRAFPAILAHTRWQVRRRPRRLRRLSTLRTVPAAYDMSVARARANCMRASTSTHVHEDLPCHRCACALLLVSREHSPSIEAGLPEPRA